MISFSSSLDIHYSLQLKGINVTQIYVSTIYFILKQGYMFRLKVSHLQVPTSFRYQMLCSLWHPIVFTFVEYILV